MTTVRVFEPSVRALLKDPGVGALLRAKAEGVEARVRPPSGLTTGVRGGVGPRGAFAQVQMLGPNAIAIEFGSRRTAPRAPLRSALRASGL